MIAMSNETNPSFKGSLKAQEFIQLRGHNVDAAPNLNDCFLKIWLPALGLMRPYVSRINPTDKMPDFYVPNRPLALTEPAQAAMKTIASIAPIQRQSQWVASPAAVKSSSRLPSLLARKHQKTLLCKPCSSSSVG